MRPPSPSARQNPSPPFALADETHSPSSSARIDAEITAPTKNIVLNALDLKLAQVAVSASQAKTSETARSTSFSYDAKAQRVSVAFDRELPAAKRASVAVDFEGVVHDDMAGFYRSRYKPPAAAAALASVPRDDEWHYMFSTQFEAFYARRAFPCVDEPNRKATFDVDLEVPADQVAVSNMPVRAVGPSRRDGWHVVSFETTPVMSTYLLAWAFGDFGHVEALTERRYKGRRLPVRVYATRGLEQQGSWALWHAAKIIDLFSRVFDIDYPLPKMNLLAVHEFTHGAMENWGLVTYRTTQVLFDQNALDARFRSAVAYVVVHELDH